MYAEIQVMPDCAVSKAATTRHTAISLSILRYRASELTMPREDSENGGPAFTILPYCAKCAAFETVLDYSPPPS